MLASILFVDDDANVLQGLRRMLYPMRQEWQMTFANSAEEALLKLSQAPFDVIVTDVRMPRMNGSELLIEVRRRYPYTARIILSGQSDKELTVQAAGPAHQYLSKPCDAEVLKQAIRSVCSLQRLMANKAVRQVVSKLQAVPSLPHLYMQVIDELGSEDVSLPRVGRAIAQDVGMSAKVLQLVNSSFFGLPKHYSSPEEAAVLLGADTLKALVVGAHIFTQFDEKQSPHVPFEAIWKHSVRASALAKAIAVSVRAERGILVHTTTAALLHDVGTLALASCLPAEFRRVMNLAPQKKSFMEAEFEVLGVTHAQAGAYLLGLWGLSDSIVEAIALHHSPTVGQVKGFTPLTAVHVAGCLSQDPICPGASIDCRYLQEIGLLQRLPEWQELARRAFEKEGRS